MNPSPLHKLLQSGKRYRRLKGQAIQTTGDGATFYVVNSGYVKRYLISKDGSLGVQSIYGPGHFFPLTPAFQYLLGQKIYSADETYFYEAMTTADVSAISHETLVTAAAANPAIYKDILAVAGRRLQSNINQLENIALKSALWRVAHKLVFWAEQFGSPQGEELIIDIPLTHQDIADMLSLSRETVSREMAKLKQRGLIKTNKHIVVTDIGKLQRIYS